jgi:peroxiredoxin
MGKAMKKTGASFLLSCIAIALLFVQTVMVSESYAVTIEKGDRAPLFISDKLEGGTFELKAHLGKNIVLLNFWSVFCRDCISRIEALNKISDLFQKRDFELVGIAGDPPTARMLSQVKKYAAKMHYDVVLDPELEVFDSYGVEIIPFAVLVDRDGTVVMAIKSLEPGPLKQISEAIDMLTKE